MRGASLPVALALIVAWLATFVPAALPALAVGSWPAAWRHHWALGVPALESSLVLALGWLIVGMLLRALPGAAHAWRSLAILAFAVLGVRFTWLVGAAGNAEIAGALLALCLWPAAERLSEVALARLGLVAAAAAVVALPLLAMPHLRGVHWLPFTDLAPLAQGARHVFWIGALVVLATGAGARALLGGLAVALGLAAVEGLRALGSAEYATATDPAIALVVALALLLFARLRGAR